jgi:hypothetical protein
VCMSNDLLQHYGIFYKSFSQNHLLQFKECGLQFVIPYEFLILWSTGHFGEWRENVRSSSPHVSIILNRANDSSHFSG